MSLELGLRIGGDAATDWGRALAWRMHRQFLLDRGSAGDLWEVVHRLAGLHTQVWSASVAAVAARLSGIDSATLAASLWSDRSLVKLWAQRGTLHLLTSADHPIWVAGLDMYRRSYAHYGMRDPQLLALAELIGDAVQHRVLSRADLADRLRRTGKVTGAVAEQLEGSWGSSLKPASFLGRLCYGPGEDGRAGFTNPSTWLPARSTETGDALAEIARRYFAVYGPATTQDLAIWWGVSARLAATMVETIRSELAQVRIEDGCFWMLRCDVDEMLITPGLSADLPVVRLLPSFDPWVVAGNRRGKPGIGNPTLDPTHRAKVYRQQGWVSPVITVNGRIVGTWAEETLRASAQPTTMFEPLPAPAAAALQAEIELVRGRP